MDLIEKKEQKILSNKSFLMLHFLICSIGLLKITSLVANRFGIFLQEMINIHFNNKRFNDWALPFFFPEKIGELLVYITGIISLFLYYIIAYILIYKNDNEFYCRITKNKKILFSYFIILLAINFTLLYLFSFGFKFKVLVSTLLWLAMVFIPFYYRIYQFLTKQHTRFDEGSKKTKVIFYSILVLITIQMFSIFSPFISGRLLMINEYFDIPEETLVQDRYIDNNSYFNSHDEFYIQKYNIESKSGISLPPRKGFYTYLKKTPLLINFIQNNKTKYFYNDNLQALCIIGKMTPEDRLELREIVDIQEEKNVNSLYISSNEIIDKKLAKKQYSYEEKEFIFKNTIELLWQIQNRWVIHHHNFVLGPINEYALGKNINNINMQYGLLNIVVMKNLLEHFGGITYENYFKIWYSFFIIYYGIFIGLLFLLFKRIGYILITLILSISFLNIIGFQFLFIGPGINPIRHFFDVFVIGFLFLYLSRKNNLFLIFCLLFSILALINNTQSGIFCTVALLITLVLRSIKESHKIPWNYIIPLVIIGIAAIFLAVRFGPKDQMLFYYLTGLIGFKISPKLIFGFLILFSISQILLIKFFKNKDDLNYVTLFSILYSQGMLIYYIWGGTIYHFLNFTQIYVLTGILLLKLIIDNFIQVNQYKNLIIAIIIGISLIIYVPSMGYYYYDKYIYYKVFDNHKTYEWDLDTAKFKSTMNPKYFINGINLINKYSFGNNFIYIISKYDNFLPFLSKKYSAMPFFDVSWFLLTSKEVDQSIDTINNYKPTYLFVDTDIERNLSSEIIPEEIPFFHVFHTESLLRVLRLNELKKVYEGVKDDYYPLEKGYLITVYKRKQGNT